MGRRKQMEPVARERGASIRRVCPGHTVARRKNTSISPRHPQEGRYMQATAVGQTATISVESCSSLMESSQLAGPGKSANLPL